MKQDPKPQIGRAAIMANIEYCIAQQQNAGAMLRAAYEMHTMYLRQLEKLNAEESITLRPGC